MCTSMSERPSPGWIIEVHTDMSGEHRGQALVEFGLTLPLLLVILLGVADLGRVFQAGIVMESAARAAAEAAALEYNRDQPPDPNDPEYATFDETTYYQRLHELAAQAACEEARILTNTTYDAANRDCTTGAGDQWPVIRVCVHDDDPATGRPGDPDCGDPIAGYASSHADCDRMDGGWTNAPDVQSHFYVEVRVCYQFTTLFNVTLPLATGITVGEIFLQKEAHFTVADY